MVLKKMSFVLIANAFQMGYNVGKTLLKLLLYEICVGASNILYCQKDTFLHWCSTYKSINRLNSKWIL